MSLPLSEFQSEFQHRGQQRVSRKLMLSPAAVPLLRFVFILISSSAFFGNGTRDDAHNDLSIGKRPLATRAYRAFINNIKRKITGKNDRKRRLRDGNDRYRQRVKVRG